VSKGVVILFPPTPAVVNNPVGFAVAATALVVNPERLAKAF
jgi:hypothetical protein